MPQINRIRIINFSYNNDKRHIIDESFNFYSTVPERKRDRNRI